MTAIFKNITIDQGADYTRPFLILDENCNPVDITGAVAAMQVSVMIGYPAALTLTTSNGGLIVDGPAGMITPVISSIVTSALVPGAYVYDVKLTFANGRTVRPFQGTATVSPEVTLIAPPYPAPAPSPPAGVYTDEDGTTGYTQEDGTTPYTQES